jgi:predicted RNA-binding Zn ribbon-like protein
MIRLPVDTVTASAREVNEMESAPTPAELEFRFVAGNRALDLLCTRANRHRQPIERLRQPSDLDRWLDAAMLPVPQQASPRDLEQAHRLRETVNRITRETLAGATPAAEDLAELNDWARRPPLIPQVDPTLQRRWIAEDTVQAALALIAREAVELMTSPDRSLIRECAAAPDCSLLYLDRSRAGRRRWCQMEVCGSRAKMTSYRRRREAHDALAGTGGVTPTSAYDRP